MYREHTIGVVVPAYNEASFVGGVVRDLPDFVDRIYAVDDASTDATWDAIRRVSAEVAETESESRRDGADRIAVTDGFGRLSADRHVAAYETEGRVTRIRHAENRGAGGAIQTGYLAALSDDIDVIATIDGDGQMDASLLPRLLDPIVAGRAEYAKGNRFADTARVVSEMPPFRLFGNVLLTGLTRVATGYWGLSDPQNGFTAASREALLAADVESLWEYYGYMNQLMARLNAEGVRIADVPVPTTYGDEESGIDYSQYIRKVSWLLVASLAARLRPGRGDRLVSPVAVGYLVGTLATLAGVGRTLRLAGRNGGGSGESGRGGRRLLLAGLVGFLAGVAFDTAEGPVVVDEPSGAASEAPDTGDEPRSVAATDGGRE
ncbi:glycosyltransferase family 2 protein [Halorussus amylolyticus]|uniref:glycosyltransferase family 2 protein n=1 Tax=Halorussus amylolyticus TaxID=1126242 RepID=UPI00104D2451|nr:glycosyltransferase family 2 protein [Halorussus amylolyticus]